MSYVVKTRFIDAHGLGSIVVAERPMYAGGEIRVGREAYVWFSESEGGRGLEWRTMVERVQPMSSGRIRLTLRLVSRTTSALGVEQLRPFRGSTDGSALSGLSRKLYYQSHDKIAALSTIEDEFLRSRFE